MKYIIPEAVVYISSCVVNCSGSGDIGTNDNTGSSGGIQLPFIPG